MRAKYLLRFDDICPTMNWDVWNNIEEIIIQNKLKPILAVVPDNTDESLKVDEHNEFFWEKVRYWQNLGWTIGIHGYQHNLRDSNYGLIPISKKSEFVGDTYKNQIHKIEHSLNILKKNSIKSDLWIAPAHSFDENTLKALKTLKVSKISDGLNIFPHIDINGIFWIPQQLWKFRRLFFGVWTVCFHHNKWDQNNINKFEDDIEKYKNHITDLESVSQDYSDRKKSIFDNIFSFVYILMLRAKRILNTNVTSS